MLIYTGTNAIYKYLYIIIYIQTRTCNFKPNTCVHGGLKRIRPCQPKNYPTGLHASVKNLTQSALANLGGRLIRTPPFFFYINSFERAYGWDPHFELELWYNCVLSLTNYCCDQVLKQ